MFFFKDTKGVDKLVLDQVPNGLWMWKAYDAGDFVTSSAMEFDSSEEAESHARAYLNFQDGLVVERKPDSRASK